MTIDDCITYWAMQYKEPLTKEYCGSKTTNPALLSTKRWLDDNFVNGTERLEKFCYYVEDTFIKTTHTTYPDNAHLSKLYVDFQKNRQPFQTYKPLSHNEIKKIEEEKKDIVRVVPEHMNVTREDLEEESKKMTDHQLLKKYGINIMGWFWSEGVFSKDGKPIQRKEKFGEYEIKRAF